VACVCLVFGLFERVSVCGKMRGIAGVLEMAKVEGWEMGMGQRCFYDFLFYCRQAMVFSEGVIQ
jgi:hypothetical protein